MSTPMVIVGARVTAETRTKLADLAAEVSVADALLVVDEVGPEDAEAVIARAQRDGLHPVAVARGMDADATDRP